MSDDKLPKQDLLLKILNMTTSDNDNMSLVSIRKANALLAEAGWSWEKLLAGKIVVVADPFSNLQAPPKRDEDDDGLARRPRNPSPPARPQPHQPKSSFFGQNVPPRATPQRPQPTPAAKPSPSPPPNPFNPLNQPYTPQSGRRLSGINKPNKYPGYCYCCGDPVDVNKGHVFNASEWCSTAADKWTQICNPCKSGNVNVRPSPAPRNKPLHPSIDPALQGVKPNLGDL